MYDYSILKGTVNNGWTSYVASIKVEGKTLTMASKYYKGYEDVNPLDVMISQADMYTNSLADVKDFGLADMLDTMGIDAEMYSWCEMAHNELLKAFGADYSDYLFDKYILA